MDEVIANTSESVQTQETVQEKQERTFRQSDVNEIVGRAKAEAVESYKQRQQQQQYKEQPQQSYQAPNKSLSEDDIKRLAGEELARQRGEWTREVQEKADADAAQRIVNAYKEKISTGKDRYEDFEKVTSGVDMRHYTNVVQLLAEHVDNSADVLYDLARHRTKLNEIEALCERNPQDGIYEIKRLSESIKANEEASKVRTSKSPLSQQRPSVTGTDSGQTLSMRDLKSKYRA